jgi:hypothetical protein
MTVFAVVFVVVLVGAAVYGDWAAAGSFGGKPPPLAGWLGAYGGALVVLLGLNGVLMFAFAIDPWYMLVQEFLIAGIVAGLISLPMSLVRNLRARRPARRTVGEAAAAVALAGLFLGAVYLFRELRPPHQLPI